jgi:Domain of unknown function (DUF4340)
MNFRTTAILLVVVLGVGAYLMFTGQKTGDTSLEQTNPTRLLDFSSNDVSKVVITPEGGKRIVLERHTLPAAAATIGPAQSDWKLDEPIDAFADASKVSDLIDAIVSATSTAQVSVGSSAADYGLDTPQFTIDLEAGPKSATLDIGRQVKAGNELYVRIEGKDVAQVISGDVLDKIDTTPDQLRLSRLINADTTTANWISIQRPTDPVVLEKSGGQWQMSTTRPTTLPAEQSAVSDLISSINSATANGFATTDENPDLLIGKPQATVIVSDQKPTTQPAATETIEFGSPDSLVGKNIWVRVTPPGLLATVPKETMDGILKSSLDLRDRAVMTIAPASVKELRIIKSVPATTQPIARAASLHEVVLVRRPPKKPDLSIGPTTRPTTAPIPQPASVWQLTGTRVPTDADDSKVDAALANFNPLRVDKYLPAAPPATGRTTYLVTIIPDKGDPIRVFLSDPGENATDQPSGSSGDAIFALPRTVITSLDVDYAKSP